MRLKRSRNVRAIVREFASPKFIWGAVAGLIAALTLELIYGLVRNTLSYQVAGFYLVLIVALISLTLVGNFLDSIQHLVENRNYTRFITSKSERLNLMTECIKRASKSIYILSDLSTMDETQLQEHEKYVEALNQAIKDNKGNPGFDVKRIVVPSNTLGKDLDSDPNWIYKISVTGAYLEHFRLMRDFDQVSPKYKNGPRNVSIMLIDNKYLFWKPELSFEEAPLDRLMDGGIYFADYSPEGIAEFSDCFRIMYDNALPIKLENFDSTKTQK